MSGNNVAEPRAERELLGATAYQLLHWLASGSLTSERLLSTQRAAIDARNGTLNAFVALADDAPAAARASDARRQDGHTIGRLDGLTVAIKDNLDVAGLPTGAGLASRRARIAERDAAVVERLRCAGAIIVGKTNLDEGALGTTSVNLAFGATANPHRAGFTAGGSSGGSAVAVAAGLCAFAIGSDTLGSVRIPASHCGVFGLRPTNGEISTRGLVRAARRLDSVGILARSVEDLTVVLQVLDTHDPADPRSRRRRVPLATPDWEPGKLRSGVVGDLAALGVASDVADVFARALATVGPELGERHAIALAGHDLARMRRAGLLVMESELAVEFADDLVDTSHPVSPRLRSMIDFARSKTAVDYARADRAIDDAIVLARRLFAEVDVLVLPTVPHGPYSLDETERANDADLTAFASLAGCPALSLPMGTLPDGMPVGLQLVGAPGSDLRLLELAEVVAATLDAAPTFPVGQP